MSVNLFRSQCFSIACPMDDIDGLKCKKHVFLAPTHRYDDSRDFIIIQCYSSHFRNLILWVTMGKYSRLFHIEPFPNNWRAFNDFRTQIHLWFLINCMSIFHFFQWNKLLMRVIGGPVCLQPHMKKQHTVRHLSAYRKLFSVLGPVLGPRCDGSDNTKLLYSHVRQMVCKISCIFQDCSLTGDTPSCTLPTWTWWR